MSVMPYVFPAAAVWEKSGVEKPDLILTVAVFNSLGLLQPHEEFSFCCTTE